MAKEDNIYEQRLVKATEILVECQKEHGLKSCFSCEKLLDCDIRRDYVKAVYESMSKGESGGFEF